jgi:hypothetical protein
MVRLPLDLYSVVTAICVAEDRSLSQAVRMALRDWVAAREPAIARAAKARRD